MPDLLPIGAWLQSAAAGLPLLLAQGQWHADSALAIAEDVASYHRREIVLAGMVTACYVMWLAAYVLIITKARRHRTWGMPILGCSATLAIEAIALYGPFSSQSHLFYYRGNYVLLGLWGLMTLLTGAVYVQYILHGRDDSHLLPELRSWFYPIVLGIPVMFGITFWTFVVYYQDYYINEICPIAVLVLSVDYFTLLYRRPDGRGLSLPAAWLMAVGDLLLWSAVVLGDMSDPYPDASFGYAFIYWIYFITLVFHFAYPIILGRRMRTQARMAAVGA